MRSCGAVIMIERPADLRLDSPALIALLTESIEESS
jgi:hypothetical protein